MFCRSVEFRLNWDVKPAGLCEESGGAEGSYHFNLVNQRPKRTHKQSAKETK